MILQNAFKQISQLLRFENTTNNQTKIINSSHDKVTKTDILCNEIIINDIKNINMNIIGYISEETKQTVFFDNYQVDTKKNTFIVAFDPLDGSSNYSFNVNTGSIYGVYEYCKKENKLLRIVHSGYCLYGVKTIMVYTFHKKIFMTDIFHTSCVPKLVHFNNIAKKDKIYSINQSNDYEPEIRHLVRQYINNDYTMRWVGTLVADAHRILMNDGIFYYPVTKKHPFGKIRTLYEAMPFAYIFELA